LMRGTNALLASTSSTRLLKLDFESAAATATEALYDDGQSRCFGEVLGRDVPWLRVDVAGPHRNVRCGLGRRRIRRKNEEGTTSPRHARAQAGWHRGHAARRTMDGTGWMGRLMDGSLEVGLVGALVLWCLNGPNFARGVDRPSRDHV
jgi:hypothetical protein